jgi:hypothetical protein
MPMIIFHQRLPVACPFQLEGHHIGRGVKDQVVRRCHLFQTPENGLQEASEVELPIVRDEVFFE